MKYLFLLIIALPICGTTQIPVNISNDPSWNITPMLSDEFNQNYDESDPQNVIVCDPNKWVNYTPWVGESNGLPGNDVACQSYDNVYIQTESGTSFLRLAVTETSSSCNVGERDYSIGVLFSQEYILQKYGYWEIKMRIPHPPQPGVDQGDFYGLSSNAWLWNSWGVHTNPEIDDEYSEIDIAEIHANHLDFSSPYGWRNNRHTCNVHFDPSGEVPTNWPDWPADFVDNCEGQPCVQYPQGYFYEYEGNVLWHSYSMLTMRQNTSYSPIDPEDADLNLSPGWHTFSCLWLPDKITVFIDGEMINSTTIGCPGLNKLAWVVGPAAGNQFEEPNFTSNTDLPYYMDVDYIRTYSLDGSMDCNTIINNCSWDPDSYDHMVKKSITFGGSSPTCNNSIDTSPGIYLKATDFIQIDGNFTVPVGKEFSAEIYACQ